ncbi:hypothetical protein A6A40_23860 (plasmid) [Azospirillum humicireducens]|uniref:Uncharacterized protein n=1 Tax=Azospirillum humicireducens TaxID=1226968 RepID=A0A2R4VUF7_9PROT|nr:hypothetical protein A6A40_23860 [Azospirillum humicireducens]
MEMNHSIIDGLIEIEFYQFSAFFFGIWIIQMNVLAMKEHAFWPVRIVLAYADGIPATTSERLRKIEKVIVSMM